MAALLSKYGRQPYEGCKPFYATDCVVIPNNLHLLAGGMARDSMLRQVESWKKWTALRINRALGPFDKLRAARTGRFWQDGSFDQLVRSQTAFEKFRRTIAGNPIKAVES